MANKTRFEILSDQLDGWLSPEDLNTLRKTEATKGTFAQFAYELKVLKQKDLHPFGGHVWFSGQWNKSRGEEDLQVGVKIDGLRFVAERTGQYDGQEGPYWCGRDGEWREVWLEDDYPAAAKVVIYRKDMSRPLTAIARWSDYVGTNRKDEPTYMWDKMGPHMLAKCAEALGIRKAFPNQTGRLYTDDEMQQAGTDEKQPAQPPATQAESDSTGQENDLDLTTSDRVSSLNAALEESPSTSEDTRDRTTSDRVSSLNAALDATGDEQDEPDAAEAAQENAEHNGPKPITRDQVKRAYAIGKGEGGYTSEGMKRLAKRRYKKDSVTEINRAEYDSFIRDLENTQLASRYNKDPDTPDMFDGDTEAGVPYAEKSKAWTRLHRAFNGNPPKRLLGLLTEGEGASAAQDLTPRTVKLTNMLLDDLAKIVRSMPWSDGDTTAKAMEWVLDTHPDGIGSASELEAGFEAYVDEQFESVQA